MIIPNRDIATGEAANLVLTRLTTFLRGVSAPKKMIVGAIVPIFGIRWNAQVVRTAGRQKLREFLWPMRNSLLDKGSYAKIRDLWADATADENDLPPDCGALANDN